MSACLSGHESNQQGDTIGIPYSMFVACGRFPSRHDVEAIVPYSPTSSI